MNTRLGLILVVLVAFAFAGCSTPGGSGGGAVSIAPPTTPPEGPSQPYGTNLRHAKTHPNLHANRR